MTQRKVNTTFSASDKAWAAQLKSDKAGEVIDKRVIKQSALLDKEEESKGNASGKAEDAAPSKEEVKEEVDVFAELGLAEKDLAAVKAMIEKFIADNKPLDKIIGFVPRKFPQLKGKEAAVEKVCKAMQGSSDDAEEADDPDN